MHTYIYVYIPNLYTVVEAVFTYLTALKEVITQFRNTLLQVKVLNSKFYLSKSTQLLASNYTLITKSKSTHYAQWPI